MIIYSEILGKQFNSVEDCLAAEEQYNKKLKEEEERLKKEQEENEKLVKSAYKELLNAWTQYMDILEVAGYDIDSDDKALILVEVILDGEKAKAHGLKS